MSKKKSLFITFEGIEGSGKSYQSLRLYKKIKRKGYSAIYTREPGGTKNSESIRKIILTGKKNKFTKVTDTLLYLASRNENFKRIIKPSLSKKKIVICDRFIDSTLAYQVYGNGVSRSLVNSIHDYILGSVKPDLTFILKLKLSKAFERINRRKKNRYDKFSKIFYKKVQNAFIRISKQSKKRYVVLDTSNDTSKTEDRIYKKFLEKIK